MPSFATASAGRLVPPEPGSFDSYRELLLLLLVEDEIHGDEGFDFDRFAVEARWLIAPLAYGL